VYPVSLTSRVACRLREWTGLQTRAEERATGGAVLVYHGVLARVRDPILDLYAIDAATFRSHLQFLVRRGTVVPLRTMVERLVRREEVPRQWVSITLDDALENQVTTAAGLLADEGLPWSLAVPAGLVDTGRSIWTYELRLLVLEHWPFPNIPWPFEEGGELRTGSAGDKRAALRQMLSYLFAKVEDGERMAYIDGLIDRCGRGDFLGRIADDARFRLASWTQLRSLQHSGVELLSHGWRHRPQNETTGPGALAEEIEGSRRLMGERLGQAPAGFALPHGVSSSETPELITRAGYTYCLSTQPRRLRSGADLRHLPRFAGEYPLAVLRRYLLWQ